MEKPLGPEATQAAIDQALASSRDFARLTAGYWRGLIEFGVEAGAAALITASYIQAVVATAPKPDA